MHFAGGDRWESFRLGDAAWPRRSGLLLKPRHAPAVGIDQPTAKDVARTPLGAFLPVIELAIGAGLAFFVVGPLVRVDLRGVVLVAELLRQLLIFLDPLLGMGQTSEARTAQRSCGKPCGGKLEEAATSLTRSGISHNQPP
jgi:hypothetical protein